MTAFFLSYLPVQNLSVIILHNFVWSKIWTNLSKYMDENINSVGMVFCLRMVVLDPRITCKTFDSNKMKTASHMKVNQSYYTNQSQSACRNRRKKILSLHVWTHRLCEYFKETPSKDANQPKNVDDMQIFPFTGFPALNFTSYRHSHVDSLFTNQEQKKDLLMTYGTFQLGRPCSWCHSQTARHRMAALTAMFYDFQMSIFNKLDHKSTEKLLWVCFLFLLFFILIDMLLCFLYEQNSTSVLFFK